MTASRGPRGPYSTGIARRRQIVDEAVRLFGSVGYNGGSLRKIAQEVGISPAAISRHFASKEELLMAVLERWDEEVTAQQDEQGEGLEVWLRLRQNLQYHEDNRNMLALFLTVASEATSEAHPAHDFMRNRYTWAVRRLREGLQDAVDREEVRPMTEDEVLHESRSFLAFVDGIELQYLLRDDFSLVEAFDHEWERRRTGWGARATS